jgi:cell wall-associated NlpC family hydrolase
MPRFSWAVVGLGTVALSTLLAPMVVLAEPNPTSSVHVVQPGDSLLQIALDAGTDTDTLATLNGLGDANVLSVGQTLKLRARAATTSAPPTTTTSATTAATAAPAAASSYTIASGDNLWDVAQRFGTTTDAIVQLNHLDDADHLSLGTVLSLPAGSSPRPSATSAPAATPTSAPAASPAGGSTAQTSKRNVMVSYTVQPGETLVQIARQFNVRAETIVQASNLDDANKIVVGSVLKVPVGAKEHVVTDGETLRDIASSEKVDLGSLIDFNQIDDPALIRVGQVVLLPMAASGPPGSTTAAPAATSTPTAAPSPAPSPAATSAPQPETQAAAVAQSRPLQQPSPTPSPKPTTSPAPAPAAAGGAPASTAPGAAATRPAAAPTASPKPAAPIAAVPVPAGSPSDGLAGAALKFLGTPYVWGGSSPRGFDCSGFVWYVGRQLNKQLSRGMFGQYNSGSHPSRDDLKPGDLVFFQNTFAPGLSHNGIYIGNGKFVNAADESAGVTISNLNTGYWSAHWFGATRLP